MSGAGLFWEKSTTGWLPVTGLLWEESTADWRLISKGRADSSLRCDRHGRRCVADKQRERRFVFAMRSTWQAVCAKLPSSLRAKIKATIEYTYAPTVPRATSVPPLAVCSGRVPPLGFGRTCKDTSASRATSPSPPRGASYNFRFIIRRHDTTLRACLWLPVRTARRRTCASSSKIKQAKLPAGRAVSPVSMCMYPACE
jgi:hypothetical protein